MTATDILFNDGWQFCLTDIGTELSALPQQKWYNVELPHDWLIGDTANLYKTGEGWYKRILNVTAEELNGHVMLNFDGVYFNSTVFVNGKEAGSWTYGYSAFEFDITALLSEGDNEILVRVEHQSPNTRWYSGAGIYRDVTLKYRKKTYIRTNGVYIHSEKGEGDTWHTEIETDICGEAADITVTIAVVDPEGNNIAAFEQKAAFGGGEENFLNSFDITSPAVWDIDSPDLYTLVVTVFKDDEVLDYSAVDFGYRTAEFLPEKGLVLNGRQLKMHGVCMHHDLGALGAAINEAALYRQMKIMKDMGCNAIRTSHNMPAKQLVQICDKLGLLVDCESFDMWENSKTEYDNHLYFNETLERDVKSWVERDRNHPCVIMWSIGNEISDTNYERGIEITKRLRDAVLMYDPKKNAAVTIGSNFMGSEMAQRCTDELKLAGYNYAEYFYNDHHKKYPDWTIYGSETASAVRSRGIYRFPADIPLLTHEDLQCSSLDNSFVGWGCSAKKAWRLDRDCDFCAGQYIWTGFDYIGEPTPYSTKNSYFGIVDTAGFPKDIYYFYQSVWFTAEELPVIHIVPYYWDFTEGQEIDVIVYSNAHTVELFLNGKSIGKHEMKLDTDKQMRADFRVPFEKGELTAKGYDTDGAVIMEDSIKTCGDPAKVVLEADRAELFADARDISFIEISVVDKDGIPVGNARNRVKVEVSGAGRLVGLDNGDSTDYDSYKGDNRRLFSGKLLAMVQSTLDEGEITVKVTSEGLEGAELKLVSEYCGECSGVSVVTENAYPAVTTEYTNEIPVRRIEVHCDGSTALTAENPTAKLDVKLFPDNASYSDITWKCVRKNGVEVGNAKIDVVDGIATVTAFGDGDFIARAFLNNGAQQPQVYADLCFTAEGLGEAAKDAYSFISASKLDSSNVMACVIEDGAVGNITERTVLTYNSVDFGKTGTDTLILHIGACSDVYVEVWEGTPDDGRLISALTFNNNGCWCGFKPQEFALADRLSGMKDISVVVNQKLIFGGFEFVEVNRAFDVNYTAESDSIYGDEYSIEGRSVVKIGNNVIINYDAMDFGENGASAITICGATANPEDTVQLRYTPVGGTQNSMLMQFAHSDGDSEQRFEIPKLDGVQDISFVFLPGTKFDFKWFRFE